MKNIKISDINNIRQLQNELIKKENNFERFIQTVVYMDNSFNSVNVLDVHKYVQDYIKYSEFNKFMKNYIVITKEVKLYPVEVFNYVYKYDQLLEKWVSNMVSKALVEDPLLNTSSETIDFEAHYLMERFFKPNPELKEYHKHLATYRYFTKKEFDSLNIGDVLYSFNKEDCSLHKTCRIEKTVFSKNVDFNEVKRNSHQDVTLEYQKQKLLIIYFLND